MKTNLSKVIGSVKKITESNDKNVLIITEDKDIIVGNYNAFFIVSAKNTIKSNETAVFELSDFPKLKNIDSIDVSLEDMKVQIKTKHDGYVTVALSEILDAEYIEESEKILNFINEAFIDDTDTLGKRSFMSEFDHYARLYLEHKRAITNFSNIDDIRFNKNEIFTTDGHIIMKKEFNTKSYLSIPKEIGSVLSFFQSPFTIYTSNIPDNQKMSFRDENDSDDEAQEKYDNAPLPQIMFISPNLKFVYTHISKNLKPIENIEPFFKKEKALFSFMIEKKALFEISETAIKNDCDKVYFFLKNCIYAWAENNETLVIKEKLPLVTLHKYAGKVMFILNPKNIILTCKYAETDYFTIDYFGIDSPIIFNNDILCTVYNFLDVEDFEDRIKTYYEE